MEHCSGACGQALACGGHHEEKEADDQIGIVLICKSADQISIKLPEADLAFTCWRRAEIRNSALCTIGAQEDGEED